MNFFLAHGADIAVQVPHYSTYYPVLVMNHITAEFPKVMALILFLLGRQMERGRIAHASGAFVLKGPSNGDIPGRRFQNRSPPPVVGNE